MFHMGRIWLGYTGVAAIAAALSPMAMQSQSVAFQYAELPEAREIDLARSAAPPWFSDSAAVYVLRGGSFMKVRDGSKGACAVLRDHPESLYPICFDVEATRTILPIEFRRQQLYAAGSDDAAVEREIDAAIARGELQVPSRPALTYMMSRDQVLYAGAKGPRVGAWHPHTMLYIPYARPEVFGIPQRLGRGDFQVANAGKATAHLIMWAAEWSRPESAAARGTTRRRGGST